MMAGPVPRGLRGRVLAAFVITSALTLVVAAAVLYGPLQSKLRDQSVENLRDAVLNSRTGVTNALGNRIAPPKHGTTSDPDTRPGWDLRRRRIGDAALALRQRIDARVLVDADDADGAELPEFFYDSDFAPS